MAFDHIENHEPGTKTQEAAIECVTCISAAKLSSCKTGDGGTACHSQVGINSVLTDDSLRAILSKLETQGEKDNYGLVCKRWLMVQSSERRRMGARAGPFMLQKLATRFTSLVELDYTQNTSRSFYPGVIDADLETIAGSFCNLERINLQECIGRMIFLFFFLLSTGIGSVNAGITDAGIATLAKGLPGLRWVVFSGCKKVSDKGVEALASGCSKLLGLFLARCKLVSDKALKALARSCRELESLDVTSCFNVTDNGIQALSRGCCRLQALDISKCVKVGDLGVSSIAQSCPSLKSFKLLDCSRVTDESISLLAQRCRGLENLVLGGCRRVTSVSIEAIARECGSGLRHLQLEWCSELTDEAVIAVFSHCEVLERLDLQSCTKITDHAMEGLQLHGSALKQLKLNHCPNISDEAIKKIAAFCHKLQLLEAKNCPQLTQEALATINLPAGCKVVYDQHNLEH